MRSLFNVFGQNKIEFILPIKFSNKDIFPIFSEKSISRSFGISNL